MKWKARIATLAVAVLVPGGAWGADGQNPATASDAQPAVKESILFPNRTADYLEGSPLVARGQSPAGYGSSVIGRFGWWATSIDGDLTKIGEWQDLDRSPFWDIDGLASNGESTFDFFATGTDLETTQVGGHYYRPGLTTDVQYQRFLHRLDHDPLENFLGIFPSQPKFDAEEGALTNPGDLNRTFLSQDLNVGENYAIRVQELDVKFKGNFTENIKWRLNLWGMRKSGERQARAASHCFNGAVVDTGVVGGVTGPGIATDPAVPAGARACHVLSQRQRIDWLTTEIEPVLEGRFGPLTLEYSRVMRGFSQDDDLVTRNHTTNNVNRSIGGVGDGVLPVGGTAAGSVVAYAVVPENFTEIDRLKIGLDVSDNTGFYGLLFTGNNHNKNRETDRRYSGFDLRLTNHSIDGLSVTGYAKKLDERNQDAPFFALDGTEVVPSGQPDAGLNRLEHPWNRDRTSAGVKGRWRWFNSRRLAFTGSYDYTGVHRDFTDHETTHPDQVFTQEVTAYNTFKVGADMQWCSSLETKLYYTRQNIDNPIFAAHEPNGVTNSSLPDSVDLVDLQGTWYPSDNFLVSATFGIENRSQTSNRANFEEDNYPIIATAWYAPTSKWSVSGGYGYFSNWISQDITLGDQTDRWVDKGSYWRHYLDPATTRWDYGGTSQVVNVGTRYDYTRCLTLMGNVEWSRSRNSFVSPSADPYNLAGAGQSPDFPVTPDWSDLPGLSDVLVETTRFTAGVDYLLSDSFTCFFRYNFFDYEDKSVNRNSGTAHLFLAGLSGSY